MILYKTSFICLCYIPFILDEEIVNSLKNKGIHYKINVKELKGETVPKCDIIRGTIVYCGLVSIESTVIAIKRTEIEYLQRRKQNSSTE